VQNLAFSVLLSKRFSISLSVLLSLQFALGYSTSFASRDTPLDLISSSSSSSQSGSDSAVAEGQMVSISGSSQETGRKRKSRSPAPKRGVRLRSDRFLSPTKASSSLFCKLDRKGQSTLATPTSGIQRKRIYRERSFPGFGKLDKGSTSPGRYFGLSTGAPYGNTDLFEDVLSSLIAPGQVFNKKSRALILIYNLIKNQGELISDYYYSSNKSLANRLLQAGIRESYRELSLPADIGLGTYEEVWSLFDSERIDQLEKAFYYSSGELTWQKIQLWIDSNTRPEQVPVAHIDHILAKSQSGSNDLRNAAVCSGPFNLWKSDRFLNEIISEYE